MDAISIYRQETRVVLTADCNGESIEPLGDTGEKSRLQLLKIIISVVIRLLFIFCEVVFPFKFNFNRILTGSSLKRTPG